MVPLWEKVITVFKSKHIVSDEIKYAYKEKPKCRKEIQGVTPVLKKFLKNIR